MNSHDHVTRLQKKLRKDGQACAEAEVDLWDWHGDDKKIIHGEHNSLWMSGWLLKKI